MKRFSKIKKNQLHSCHTILILMYHAVPITVYNCHIGRLRKSGGQKVDLISLLLNKFS